MKTYNASRLSDGNKIFPDQIIIDEQCITLKIPSMFSGKEKILLYNGVSSVHVNCPIIGYSTISITTVDGEVILAAGFTRNDVHEMKNLIVRRL